MKYHTFKHFSEYRFVEWVLDRIADPEKRDMMREKLTSYEKFAERPLVWPFYRSYDFQLELEKLGIAKKISLGEGEIVCCDVFDAVSETDRALRGERVEEMLRLGNPAGLEWYLEAKKYW